jgi:hypothetical protein
MVFLGGYGGICGILEWLEGFRVKDMGSCRVWKFFEDFFGFFLGFRVV